MDNCRRSSGSGERQKPDALRGGPEAPGRERSRSATAPLRGETSRSVERALYGCALERVALPHRRGRYPGRAPGQVRIARGSGGSYMVLELTANALSYPSQ